MNVTSQSQPVLKISTRAAKVNIRQRRPQLRIRHRRPQMKIRRKAPVFRINRSVSNVKIKKTPVIQISKRFVRIPGVAASKYSEKFVLDGQQHQTFDQGPSNMELIMQEPIETITPESNTKTISLEKINLEWEQGYFEIDWTQSIMDIDWNMDILPEIQVEPHEVNIHVQNKTKKNFKMRKFLNPVGAKLDKRV